MIVPRPTKQEELKKLTKATIIKALEEKGTTEKYLLDQVDEYMQFFDNLETINEKLSNKENTLYMYKSLTKDLSKFNEYYDEMTFVKEATSSKKGIPLYIIRKYLKMIKEIKYPYKELTDLERDRIDDYRGYHMADYKDVHVYYTTVGTLGAGYRIIATLSKVTKDNDFGCTATEITDVDNLLNCF